MTAPTTMHNAFDPSMLGDLPASQRAKIERRENVLGPGYRLFYREPLEIVRGSGAHLFGPRRHRLPRCLQQRALGRPLPSPRGRGDPAAVSAPHSPYALPQRRRRPLCRAAARDLSRRARQSRPHLHRQRGERPGPEDRAGRDRRHGLRRLPLGLSRQYRGRDRDLALLPADPRSRAACARRPAARPLSPARRRSRLNARRGGRRGDRRPRAPRRPLCRHDRRQRLLERRHPLRPRRPASPRAGARACGRRPAHRGRGPAWLRPHRGGCGASRATRSFPTSSRWESRWETATPWAASSSRPELTEDFGRQIPGTSTPSAATPCRSPLPRR